jgi:DNA-binding response OmpR family regulator
MNGSRILVVDDDEAVRMLVRELLERTGAIVREAVNGREALRVLYDARPDLIVLDVSMPDMDGWQALERIRDMTEVPVLMLTARSGEMEKVRGLQAGADDYVLKPFGRQEFLARVGALLRRARRNGVAEAQPRETYEDELVRVDVPNARAEVKGRPLQLTPLEFRLLIAFMRHPDQVLSREQIMDQVWGDTSGVATDQVKLYVGYLRRKLEEVLDEGTASPIETVRGFGYRWMGSRS